MRVKIEQIGFKRPFLVGERAWQLEMDAAALTAAEEALRLFQKTTRTWNTEVRFTKRKIKDGYSVGTSNRIYGYVNAGTRPHVIRPKRAKALTFRLGYKAKTRLRTLASYNGGATGEWRSKRDVYHPGTKARDFTSRVAEEARKVYEREMRKSISKLAGK